MWHGSGRQAVPQRKPEARHRKGGASPQSVLAMSQSVTGHSCAGSGMRDGGDSVPASARRPATASQAQASPPLWTHGLVGTAVSM